MELNDAVAKMWQIQNMPDAVALFENPNDSDVSKSAALNPTLHKN